MIIRLARKFEIRPMTEHENEIRSDGECHEADHAPPNTPEQGSTQRSASELLIDLAGGAEFFHAPDGEAFATIVRSGHRETWPLRSRELRRWLAGRFYERTSGVPGAQAMNDAFSVLEGRAIFDGAEQSVHVRVAGMDPAIYLDLGNRAWEAIEVTANGWRVISDPPVKFRRPRGMLALPYPEAGGSIAELGQFVNVPCVDMRIMIEAWLIMTLRPTGPYPVLVLYGEQGSAKSTATRVLRALLDPNAAALRSAPRDTRDLMIAANNGWCMAFDNLSHLPRELSDAVCRLATGGGFATRELYTDSEERLFNAMRPVLLNGIEEFVVRGDLLDRAVVVELPAIPDEHRMPEAKFWRNVEEAHPRLLGALLEGASCALRRSREVRLDCLPRMADFAIWASAAEPALGLAPGAFLRAYEANGKRSNESALESWPFLPMLLRHLSGGALTATASDLLDKINGDAQMIDGWRRPQGWPDSPRALSNALRRLAPNLRRAGIEVVFGEREGHTGRRLITVRQVQQTPSPESPPSPA